MRGMKACFLAAFFILGLHAGMSVHAAGSNTVSMSATVIGTCKVTTPPGILDFGNIDPSGTSNVTASITFSIKCTKNTVSTAATDDGGSNFLGSKRMKHSGTPTAFLPYSISYSGDTGFTGQGFGPAAPAHNVTVNGSILPAQYQNALVTAAGEIYSDIVTITVNP
jgi:spore coat protein U-like protein